MKKQGFKFAVISACLLLGFAYNLRADDTQPPPTHDIRILIDVSGSMKWNDPENLRAPALRLLANLLPHDAQAGVWTFGRQVNMLVPLGKVDHAWKARATNAAQNIHSKGLFTNIEATLEKSTWDWKKADPLFNRTIILLTDGLVDIAKDTAENERSRDNILNNITPRLTKAGATIHTIALSGEADKLLLQQLSASSDGRYEQANNAENLERIFFRMFESTTNPETLPLINNQVVVDKSIKEMSILIFNESDSATPLTISTPTGITFEREDAPENVNWHHETRYDLITITQPTPGTWHVEADIDPDNRVMVVTDLKVVTTSLPANLYLDEQQPYFVTLTSEGEVVTSSRFLRFIDITLEQAHQNQTTRYTLLDDGNMPDRKQSDGTYSTTLDWGLNEGEHELVTLIDGTTFKREKRQRITVHAAPIITAIKPEKILGTEIETLFVAPRTEMINPDSMLLHATISDSSGEIQRLEIPHSRHNEWKLPLGDFSADQPHTLMIEVTGLRPNGQPVKSQAGPFPFGKTDTQMEKPQTAPAPLEPTVPNETEETKPLNDEEEATHTASEDPTDENAINWIAVLIPTIMFNLLLGCGAYFGFRYWKNHSTSVLNKPWEALAHE